MELVSNYFYQCNTTKLIEVNTYITATTILSIDPSAELFYIVNDSTIKIGSGDAILFKGGSSFAIGAGDSWYFVDGGQINIGIVVALIADQTTGGVVDHTLLSNIGTNTHAQIDTALTRLAGTSGTNTGDQTAAQILTAIKTVDGSGSGLDADTLDGLQATSFQPISSDLTAIDALAGTTGLLKKTATDTWALDTTAYTTNLGTVTSVSGTAPVSVATGTTTPVISMAAATAIANGYMTSTYASKLDGIEAGAQVNVATNLTATAGTTAGPTINSSTGTGIAIPSASATESGVVTTGAQMFAGVKTLTSPVLVTPVLGTPTSGSLVNCTFPILNQNTTGSAAKIIVSDTRAVVDTPQSFTSGIGADFKSNTTDGLADGGNYHGVMTLRQWSDWSGGGVRQIGFTDNNNLWVRGANADTTWSAWRKLVYEDSPVFTGNVTGLGVATGTSFNSMTALASVASPMNGASAVGTSTTVARQDHVHASDTTKAPLASPAFTGEIIAPSININRAVNTASGISWYTTTYNAWTDYMGPAGTAGQGPNGAITPASGTLVTGWGKRSFIENAAGYGWVFESGLSGDTIPTIVAEIRSSDGAARFGGDVSAPTATISGVTNANGGLSQDGNVILNGTDTWLRTTGATGWYSATYTTGMYAAATGVVTVYNNGKLAVTNTSTDSVSTTGGFTSTVATGTAPLTVASTTKVTNLNADLLDGYTVAETNTASTVAVRDSAGDIHMRLPRIEYAGNGWNGLYLLGINALGGAGTDNYARPTPVPTWNQNTTGNAATATRLSTDRTNWSSNTLASVVGQLGWKNYGNNHTIFDASNSTSPDGTAVNNTNSSVVWSSTFPTLMGWNGVSTYGVRVDSARTSDLLGGLVAATAATASTIVARDANGYIYGNYYNSSRTNEATAAASYIYDTGDGWMRKKTLANVKTEIGTSLALSGTPTAPTATAGTNTTQIATTAFVTTAISAGGGEPIDETISHLAITATTYNTDGTLATITYAGGYKTLYTYVSGNLSTVKYTGTDGVTILLTETFTYTNGNLTSLSRV